MTDRISNNYITPINNKPQTKSVSTISNTQEINIFAETQNTKVEKKQTKKSNSQVDKNPEATLDRQTCKSLGISEAEWKAMSQEEKQEANDKAIIKIVDDYNNAWYNKLLGRYTTYEAQYRRYAQRSTSEEESARIASVLKTFDEKAQKNALEYHKKGEIEYKTEACKESAQTVIANDYIEYKGQNQTLAVEGLVNTKASEKVLNIAAVNSTKADVQQQLNVVKALMTAENEKVDLTIASQQGQYGIDKDGNKNAEVELNIFKAINTSKYEKALEVAAQNISKLDVKNREKAVEVVKSTNNEKAIKAATTYATAENFSTENNIDNKELSSAIANNDKAAIVNLVNSMSTVELSQLISENINTGLIKKIMDSNPSQAVKTTINNILNRNNNKINYNVLKDQMISFGTDVQVKICKQAKKDGNLGSIKTNFLTLSAQRELNKNA